MAFCLEATNKINDIIDVFNNKCITKSLKIINADFFDNNLEFINQAHNLFVNNVIDEDNNTSKYLYLKAVYYECILQESKIATEMYFKLRRTGSFYGTYEVAKLTESFDPYVSINLYNDGKNSGCERCINELEILNKGLEIPEKKMLNSFEKENQKLWFETGEYYQYLTHEYDKMKLCYSNAKNIAETQMNLGVYYRDVEKNYVLALNWILLAFEVNMENMDEENIVNTFNLVENIYSEYYKLHDVIVSNVMLNPFTSIYSQIIDKMCNDGIKEMNNIVDDVFTFDANNEEVGNKRKRIDNQNELPDAKRKFFK